MNTIRKADQLMIPVYINEKTVLDMLAIIEDGFSMVSQVNYSEHNEKELSQKGGVGVSTSATILSKFLKINIEGELNHSGNEGKDQSVSKEKIYRICETKQKKNISEIKIDCCGDFEFGNKIFRIAEFKEKTVPDFPPETEKKAYVSLNKNFVLTLRTRKEGDIIQPFGMPEKMKLKKLFINKGVDKFERNDIILLCKDNEVLWASGVCLSEKLRVNKIPTHTISIEDR